MAELDDINRSGELTEINLDELAIGVSIEALKAAEQYIAAHGAPIPSIKPGEADPNRVFFNLDISRLCWKSPGGLVFKFRMQLA